MRKFMTTLMCLVLTTAPFALAQPNVQKVERANAISSSLTAQLPHFSGSHMAFTDCQGRMSELETMLVKTGFGRRITHNLTDGSVYVRWYDQTNDVTVTTIASPSDDGQGYSLDTYAAEGHGRWTDYLPMP
jgi:hypothetical protein